MKVKTFTGIMLLFLYAIAIASCDKKDDLKGNVKIIKMYVSNETDSYTPWGSEKPVECMLVKEENMSGYSKLPMNGILGFDYEKGHEYVLKIEKNIRFNSPGNTSKVRYRLVAIIDDKVIKIVPQWDILIDHSTDATIDISSKYNGVQGWWAIAHPPHIYVGAVFPESSFAASFDKEVTEKKQPVNLYFDFPDPYIAMMQDVRQFNYRKILKEAIASEEYKKFNYPTMPYIAKLAELKSLNDVEFCIEDNQDLANTLKKIGEQEFDIHNVRSLCMGRVIFKGFTVSMDIPDNGLFIDHPSNENSLVYVRSLTYGTSAYFLIASKSPYKEIVSSLKGPFITGHANQEVLHHSQIILLTVSDIRQEADISKSFEDLQTYLKNPFMNGQTYGYPILCKGQYAKNNNAFIK